MNAYEERQKQIDKVGRVESCAEAMLEFFMKHSNAEDSETACKVLEGISLLVEYGAALVEGRVQLREKKPRLAVLDGGRPEG